MHLLMPFGKLTPGNIPQHMGFREMTSEQLLTQGIARASLLSGNCLKHLWVNPALPAQGREDGITFLFFPHHTDPFV